MSVSSWLRRFASGFPRDRAGRIRRLRPPPKRCPGLRLNLEQLEDRTLPSSYSASSVKDLIADINAANLAGGTNTITLAAKTTFTLSKVNNTTDGSTGLPVIAAGDTLTILGNGDTIERSTASGTPAFRLFDVASRASLALKNLTLRNGLAFGSGVSAKGGAIYNQGPLVLSGVTVQNNTAQGRDGANGTNKFPYGQQGYSGCGGGIYSAGSLTLENGSQILSNQALGGKGGSGAKPLFEGGNGGPGLGGGVYVAAGTVTFISTTVGSNLARGGSGGGSGFYSGGGGDAFGGGIYVYSGTVMVTSVMVESNNVQGGPDGDKDGDNTGVFSGGGINIGGGSVTLTDDVVQRNNAGEAGGGINIVGGTVTLSRDTVQSNTGGYGGGINIYGGTVMLCSDTVQSNTALSGGGIYIFGGTVYLDGLTLANTINNTDNSGTNGSTANIDGTYFLKGC